MGNNKTHLNNTVIDYSARERLGIDINAYCVADLLHKASSSPLNTIGGWATIDSKKVSTIGKAVGISRSTAYRALQKLKAKKVIEFHSENKTLVRTTELWFSITVGQLSQFETVISQEKESNKEKEYINIPSLREGRVLKKPSCPLLNGSPLKSKYPHGHQECVEYLQFEEERRGNKFINQPKQYLAIHKTLKAGFGFDKMDRSIKAVEKKYGASAWDFMTLANWLEKGAANG